MFDILKCTASPAAFGFSKFYSFSEVKNKIVELENLSLAANQKSKKILVVLKDYSFDDGAMKIIAEKKAVCFLIDLGRIIRSKGVGRAILISKLRTFLALGMKYGAFYTFASFSESESQIRTPDEIAHIAMLLGVNRGQTKFALKMLGHYL